MHKSIPGVKPVRKKLADGSTRVFYYHRATNIRLPNDPESVEFRYALDHANREAEAARGDVKTFGWLIRAYQKSDDWRRLADSTKEIEGFNIRAIDEKFGDLPISAVEERGARSMFLDWRDKLAEKHPRAADAKLARVARILSFGMDREHLLVNPLATFKRSYRGDRSDKIWLPEHVATFTAKANPELQIALMLALHTGQRQGDLRALQWSDYDGEAISLVQSKTQASVYIPCTAALRATLDDLKARLHNLPDSDPKRRFIMTNTEGEPWLRSAFASAWERAFDAAFPEFVEADGRKVKADPAPPDLHFHDLRGTAVTMLAEAGCTVPEIASITGHTLTSVTKILERYLSRTKALAQAAITKLETKMRAA